MDLNKIIDIGIIDSWFCYVCGEADISHMYKDSDQYRHTIIRIRGVLFPDEFIGPIYMDKSKRIFWEQCARMPGNELGGLEFDLQLPSNWFPAARYIIDHQGDMVLDHDFEYVGSATSYIDSMLGGGPYDPFADSEL